MSGEGGRVLCVHCVAAADPAAALSRATPLPDSPPPRAIRVDDGLFLVATDLPLPAGGAEALQARFGDVEWISAYALAHERIVEAAQTSGAVLPLKLFSLFSGEERARAEFAARAGELRAALAHVVGCEEWGVRVRRSAAPPPAPEAAAAPRSGREFLTRKKEARDAVRRHAESAREAADAIHAAVADFARDAVRRELATDAGVRLVLDAVALVPIAARPEFESLLRDAARRAAAAGCELEATGPWPPYHFASPAPAGGDPAHA